MILLTGCASKGKEQLPETLQEKTRIESPEKGMIDDAATVKPQLFESLETLTDVGSHHVESETAKPLDLPAGELTLNADALPLKNFIHLALGEVLQLSFEVDPAVAGRDEPVTLHISKPVSADRLLGMVEETLSLFDVALVSVDQGMRVLPESKLRETPASIQTKYKTVRHGQVVEMIPLVYAQMSELQQLGGTLFQLGKYGQIMFNQRLNAIIAIGDADRIKRFREFVNFLDRPSLSGNRLRLVRPIYWSAEDLSKELSKILKVQGIPVVETAGDGGAMTVLAIKPINALLVASPKREWMKLAESMIERLDGPNAAAPGIRTFIYFSRHRDADELGALVSQALGGGTASEKLDSLAGSAAAPGAATPPATASASDSTVSAVSFHQMSGLNVVVDKKRNAIIFVGSSSAYQQVVPILDRLDIPARQMLLEVTVADVSLDDTDQLGVEWQFNNVDNSRTLTGTLGTLGGLGVGTAGLSYALTNGLGNVRARINALATRGKAKILSSPTLLATDGENAHMQVGTQISVVSQEVSNATAANAAGTSLLRSFTYIDTGVILDISPSITDYGSVRMKLKQEVSEAGAGAANSPPIFKRIVDTVLVAETGQTVLLGGLITHNEGVTRTQVPILGDIPLLGTLFRNEVITDRSTELIILITPHIVRDKEDAAYLTEAYRKRLGW